MKILILGGTGRTGKLVKEIALERGFEVNCLVRDNSKVDPHAGNQIFEGSPESSDSLEEAIKGCDAIVNTLNVSRTSDFPWARLRSPKTLLSDCMKNLIPLAEKHKVNRVVVCSAWGIADSRDELPGWFRWFVDNSNIGAAYADHERQEQLLKSSGLNWTIVRPAGLTNSKKEQKIIESYGGTPKPKMTISRLSVAKYMINALNDDSLIRKTPVLSAF